jgi:hypothetical protein
VSGRNGCKGIEKRLFVQYPNQYLKQSNTIRYYCSVNQHILKEGTNASFPFAKFTVFKKTIALF